MMPHRMNGQLNDRPLADLIREIAKKSQSGRLSIEHDRIKLAAYFDQGKFVYAACNLRDLRLRGHLERTGLLSRGQLSRFNENLPDLELAGKLTKEHLLTFGELEEAHTKQVSDVLRFALTLNEGAWTFDSRSHLSETVNLNVDVEALLLWADSKAPAKVIEEPGKTEPENVEQFLDRLRVADSYYDVLGVEQVASSEQLKSTYYALARRYHPYRFRKSNPALLNRLESAFARITQAYDTLREDDLRANYNSKLQARKKAEQIAEATAKPIAREAESAQTPDGTTTA